MAPNPRGTGAFPDWYRSLTATDVVVVVPEVADYEVRRELILARLELSLARLAAVRAAARFEPITSEIMLAAARIWAEAKSHRAAHGGEGATGWRRHPPRHRSNARKGRAVMIATTNVRYLAQFADARLWSEIRVES